MASSKFFINYRREDSELYAQTIGLTLQSRFPGQVFWDRDTLSVGVKWEDEIHRALKDCAAVIVVIGPHWLDVTDESGQRRLENENDVLRKEIRSAIGRGVPLVPVLVGDARMPKGTELPDDLKKLLEYNGMWWNIKEPRQSLAKLTGALEEILEQRRPEQKEIGHRERERLGGEQEERRARELAEQDVREREEGQRRQEERKLHRPKPFFGRPWVRWTALGLTAAVVVGTMIGVRASREFRTPQSRASDLAHLGFLQEKKGDLQAALVEYGKALEADPGNSEAKEAVERIRRMLTTRTPVGNRNATRSTNRAAPSAGGQPQGQKAVGPVDVQFSQLRMTYKAPIPYPQEALRRGIYSGEVKLETWINEQGHVQRMNPVAGSSPFVEVAESSLAQCTFTPYLQNGQPVPVHTVVYVHFRSPQQPGNSQSSSKAPSQNFQVPASHRHRRPNGSFSWCSGVLAITPQGGVSYRCNRPDPSGGGCHSFNDNLNSIQNVDVRMDGAYAVLHIDEDVLTKWDFYMPGNMYSALQGAVGQARHAAR